MRTTGKVVLDMKIGIYGGTFNPPHLGHLEAARTAVEELGLDKLFLIPAAIPPHKDLPQNTPDSAHRVTMVEKTADALNLGDKVEVSLIEVEREGKSYTADTLAQLHQQYPQAQLWLLMGTDMFMTLHQWYQPEKILGLASICAFGRNVGDEGKLFAPQVERLTIDFSATVKVISLPSLVKISSTQLRQQLAAGAGGEYLLPAVYGHILMNQLYGTHADLKHLDIPELRACSYSMVKNKRVKHIRGTEEEAVRLAERWGANPEFARRAGIIHDCTKYLGLEEQLQLCEKYDITLDGLEKQAVKLLHAKTGACIARDIFGEPDEVFQAIFWHTTSRANAALLDKILYLADYIEPNRDFDGVDHLRDLAYTDMDRALLLGVETTIQEMEERKLPIHKSTLAARAWLREQGVRSEIMI